jgi:hypothetical protein
MSPRTRAPCGASEETPCTGVETKLPEDWPQQPERIRLSRFRALAEALQWKGRTCHSSDSLAAAAPCRRAVRTREGGGAIVSGPHRSLLHPVTRLGFRGEGPMRVLIDHALRLDAYLVWIDRGSATSAGRRWRCATIKPARNLAAWLAVPRGIDVEDLT